MKTVNQYDIVESRECFTGTLVALRGHSFDKVFCNILRNRVFSSQVAASFDKSRVKRSTLFVTLLGDSKLSRAVRL